MNRGVVGSVLSCLMLIVACGGSDDSGSSGNGSGGSSGANCSGASCPGNGEVVFVPAGCEGGACSYCNASVWGGKVPTAQSDVVIPAGKTVVVDCAAEARTLKVEEGATLFASREKSATLTLHGNMIVNGVVDYGTPTKRVPSAVTAEIIFQGMKDEAYVGSPGPDVDDPDARASIEFPMKVVDGDIGMWVMGSGKLLAAGSEKRAWGKLLDPAGPGDTSFTVDDAKAWRVGDRIALTSTAPLSAGDDLLTQFEEDEIASVNGNQVTLKNAPKFLHEGCASCMRRGEAINLSRNVVLRSFDDTAHAHIMVAEKGIAQIDSAELRWLGPEKCGGPERRAALWFHEQNDASQDSFVRHASIWGGNHNSLMIERSHGIEVTDVAAYDSYGTAFAMFYDTNPCGTRCEDRAIAAPKGILFDHLIAAKIGVSKRLDGCVRIDHRMTGMEISGGEGSGAKDSVAVGIAYEGGGDDVSGFGWAEGGSGRPAKFTFTNNVTHDSNGHGAMVWHNTDEVVPDPYDKNAFWSNGGYGIHWGAYANPFLFTNTTIVDNGNASVGVKAIPTDARPRLTDATIDDIKVLAYVFVQDKVAIFRNISFNGGKKIGVTQIHEDCTTGNQNDPNDPDCVRVWLRFENVKFAKGVKPFDFGKTFNKFSVWEVRGIQAADYPNLPVNFDLYRSDNKVAGGSYNADFDAWLVPR